MDIKRIINDIIVSEDYTNIHIIPKDNDLYICENLSNILKTVECDSCTIFLGLHAIQRYFFISSLYQSCIYITHKYGLSYSWLDIECHNFQKKIVKVFRLYCIKINTNNFWNNYDFTVLLHLSGDSITPSFLEELLDSFDSKKLFDNISPHSMVINLYEERKDVKNMYISACNIFQAGKKFMHSQRYTWIAALHCIALQCNVMQCNAM